MPNPLSIANSAPRGDTWVVEELATLRRMIEELRAARSLEAASIGQGGLRILAGGTLTLDGGDIRVTGGAIILDGGDISLDGGDLVASGGELRSDNYAAGVSGWRLSPSGNLEVNDLTIRDDLIGNDALQGRVDFDLGQASSTGLTFTGSYTTQATTSFTVPAGYSRALIVTIATANASWDGTNPIALFAKSSIGALDGPQCESVIPSGSASVTAPFARNLSGLTAGQVITVALKCGVATGMSAASGIVTLSAHVIYLR